MGELIRATAARIPRNTDYDLVFTDRRGSDLSIPLTAKMTDRNLNTNRWRGEMFATSPGAYVHYLPTHGPNLYEPGPMLDDPTAHASVDVAGTVEAGSGRLVTEGFLDALRDPSVVTMASRYGDPVDLLESWPD